MQPYGTTSHSFMIFRNLTAQCIKSLCIEKFMLLKAALLKIDNQPYRRLSVFCISQK